jgi:uncharacterized protein
MGGSYHLFTVEGSQYVVDPETMRFCQVQATSDGPVSDGVAAAKIPAVVERLGRCHGGRADRARVPGLPPPHTMVLMLTYACNMACRYCCQGLIPDVCETEMPEAVAYRAVDWLVEHSGETRNLGLGLFGGEPLMKLPLIRKVVAYAETRAAAAGKRVRFGTMTNGLLFDRATIEFLAAKSVEITVSFDGPREIQDANRPLKNGAASYDVIAPRLRALLEQCPAAVMRPTLSASADIDAVLAEAAALGFRGCRIGKVSSSMLPGGMRNDEAAATDAFVAHLERQASRLLGAVRERDAMALAAVAIDRVFVEAVRQVARANSDFSPPRRRWFSCGSGRQFLTVSVSGDIYPCPRFLARPEHRIGSIWESELHNGEHRRSLLLHGRDCPQCWARYYCGGGCVVEHLAGTGSMFEANQETCRWRRAKFELAISVVANLDQADLAFLHSLGICSAI